MKEIICGNRISLKRPESSMQSADVIYRSIEQELFENGFNRLVIHTDVFNSKSAKIPQRLGYVHEGILRQEIYSESNGRLRDINVFSKLKSEYLF